MPVLLLPCCTTLPSCHRPTAFRMLAAGIAVLKCVLHCKTVLVSKQRVTNTTKQHGASGCMKHGLFGTH